MSILKDVFIFCSIFIKCFFPIFSYFFSPFCFPSESEKGCWCILSMDGGEPWGHPETPPKTKQKTKWDRADDQIAQFDFMCARHDAPQPSASHDPILETPKKSRKVSAGLRPSTCFHGWTCFCILICFMCFICFQYFSICAKGCKRHNGGEYDWNWLNTMSEGKLTKTFQQLLLDLPCLSQRAVGFGPLSRRPRKAYANLCWDWSGPLVCSSGGLVNVLYLIHGLTWVLHVLKCYELFACMRVKECRRSLPGAFFLGQKGHILLRHNQL
jgi:hypothetical protein